MSTFPAGGTPAVPTAQGPPVTCYYLVFKRIVMPPNVNVTDLTDLSSFSIPPLVISEAAGQDVVISPYHGSLHPGSPRFPGNQSPPPQHDVLPLGLSVW